MLAMHGGKKFEVENSWNECRFKLFDESFCSCKIVGNSKLKIFKMNVLLRTRKNMLAQESWRIRGRLRYMSVYGNVESLLFAV